jgi:hypothetical protein
MSDFSNQYKLSEQSGVGKKDWNKVVNYAATAVAECLKEKLRQYYDILRLNNDGHTSSTFS